MKVSPSEPGMIVSGAVHVALLVATLVVFSDTNKFQDAQESVPVEILTEQQFNQVTKGEKEAKEAKPTPVRADKAADVEEKKPTPVKEAKVDIPTPPPPLKRQPDPEDDEPDVKPVPTPPRRVAAVAPPEPPKPEIPKPPTRAVELPKVEPKPEPPKPRDAEAIEPPKPPVRPKVEPKKVEAPQPPAPPTPPKVRPAPKDVAKPKPDEKPALDKTALAKLLDQKKAEDKPASRPRSGEETNAPKPQLDRSAVSALLSREPAGGRPSTARTPSQTASLGSPTANAPKMSPSMWGQLDGLLQEQYKQCWSHLALGGQRYIPQIKVAYAPDGALVGQPSLLNPPGDPVLRGLAESAMRAVRKCNPLKIPAQFAPYHDQWKSRIVRFDPEEMSG